MANKQTNKPVNEQTEETMRPDKQTITAKVLQVRYSNIDDVENGANRDDVRLMITTDAEEFESINRKTGEIIMTQSFGISQFYLLSKIVSQVPELQLANTLAMGQPLNPQIVALALTNAKIEFTREFHYKGEQRYSGHYEADCYTSEVTKVQANILPAFSSMIMQLINTNLTWKKPKAVDTTTPNFANI